ncbi:hypothetical protein FWK35_00025722 [Aphis craccivora]|uniref:Uncharacterized protein n=1 Tax=Aphis craccivora TaxID=307492 RepID=A0A6G0Y0P6_APHCR|nr:hypothetical protein FWK35_00025722 [Aphis craccivora]
MNTRKSQNNASISNLRGWFLILVHWEGHFLKFPIVFKSAGKTKKKLRKTTFRPNRFFYMVVIQKLITLFIDH